VAGPWKPVTSGGPPHGGRLALDAFYVALAALALAARTSRLARVALAIALAWSLERTAHLGFPDLPSAGTLLAGALAGALAAVLVRRVLRRPVLALAAVAGVLGSTHAADGYVRRHADTGSTAAAPLERLFADAPSWADGRAPVAFSPRVVGPVAGDRLRHEVSLVPPGEPCAAVLARARRGYVVVERVPFPRLLAPASAPRCLAAARPVATAGAWRVYGPAPPSRQTATRSSAASRSSERSSKSSTPIAAARGSAVRRARVSSAS